MTEPTAQPAVPARGFRPAAATPAEGDQIAVRALHATSTYCEDLFWREDDGIVSVSVNCSDLFFWGCADMEELTVGNIGLLEATYAECEDRFGPHQATHAAELFAARARGMRPQGAYYEYLDEAWVALFDAAGPVREAGFGNPLTQQQAIDRRRTPTPADQAWREQRRAEREAALAAHPAAPEGLTADAADALALRALRVTGFESIETLRWRSDDGVLSMAVDCTGVFTPRLADVEPLTPDTIGLLEDTFAECQDRFGRFDALWAGELFAARARGLRPRPEFYGDLDGAWVDLFDAAGPARPEKPATMFRTAGIDTDEDPS